MFLRRRPRPPGRTHLRGRRGRAAACVAAGVLAVLAALAACHRPAHPLDLLRAGNTRREASVAGRSPAWIDGQTGKGMRINDVVRATLNASPPSRYRFELDIPRGAHLSLAAGIPPERHDKPGVQFTVKVDKGGGEQTVWTELVDPLSRPAHRKWVPVEVDLSDYAGAHREVVLETTGFETED